MADLPDPMRRGLLASVPLSALAVAVSGCVPEVRSGTAQTVYEADARQYALGNWQRWPVPEMPALPVEPWDSVAGCFWKESIADAAVDVERTARLADVDIPLETSGGNVPWDGVSYGMPYQLVDENAVKTAVLDKSKPVDVTLDGLEFPIEHLPLPIEPDKVRREGDPVGAFDLHWFGYDPNARVLYEAILLIKTVHFWNLWQSEWSVGWNGSGPPVARWDTSKLWNGSGQPHGVVATGVPMLPLITRYDEYAAGRIEHAMFAAFPNYANEVTGAARSGDGDIVGHPCRAGERLRLKEEFVTDPFSRGAHEFGLFLGDRTLHNPGDYRGTGGFTLTQDARWQGVTLPKWQLSQFEVVVQVSDFGPGKWGLSQWGASTWA